MALEQLKKELEDNLRRGMVSQKDMDDIVKQAEEYDKRRVEIESKYKGKAVLVCADELIVASTLDDAFKIAHKKFPGRKFYGGVPGFVGRI